MNKKALIIGALSTVGPIAAAISCGSNPNNPNPSLSNKSGPIVAPFANGKFNDFISTKTNSFILGNINEVKHAAIDAANKLKQLMIDSPDIRWHLTGDNVVDGFNAVRFALAQWGKNNNVPKTALRDFLDGSLQYLRKPSFTSKFSLKAAADVNDWLDHDMPIFLVDPGNLWNVHASNGDSNYRDWPYKNSTNGGVEFTNSAGGKVTALPKAKWAEVEPLRLSLPHIKAAQIRAQMCDYMGVFDYHHAEDSTNKINAELATPSVPIPGAGVYAKRPDMAVMTPSFVQGWNNGKIRENYLTLMRYNEEGKPQSSAWTEHGQVKFDFIEGLLQAAMTLYDYNDGSSSTGHRVACFAPELDSAGWNITYSSGFAMLFFMTGDAATFSNSPISTVEATDKKYTWLKTVFPNGIASKIVAQFGIDALFRTIFSRFGQPDHDYTDFFYNTHHTLLEGSEKENFKTLADIKTWLDDRQRLGSYGSQAIFAIKDPSELKTSATFYNDVSPHVEASGLYNALGGGTIYGEYAKSQFGFDYEQLPKDLIQ